MISAVLGGVTYFRTEKEKGCLHLKGYVYKFYDKRGDIIYIGVTGNIKARMCQHFTKKDLYDTAVIPKEKIGDIVRVEYTETKTMANARILEVYLIAKNKPLYNSDFVEEDDLTYELVTGDLKWKEYPIYRGENPNQDLRIYDTWGQVAL